MSASVTSGSSIPMRERPTRARTSSPRSAAFSPRNGPRSFRERSSSIICPAWFSSRGAIRKTTSSRASVKIPPRPNMTTGPNWGSWKRPATNSRRPASIGWIRYPSRSAPAAEATSAAARRTSPGSCKFRRTRPRSVLCVSFAPRPLRTTGNPNPFRGGRGLLRRRRDRLRHDRDAVSLQNLLGLRLGQGGPAFRFGLPDQLSCVHRIFLYVINPVPGHNTFPLTRTARLPCRRPPPPGPSGISRGSSAGRTRRIPAASHPAPRR